MKRIGLLSDTHSHWDERYAKYFSSCDEIWHAGDMGTLDIADRLAGIAPLRAVYGNIDSTVIRRKYPLVQRFMCEEVDVLMKHIGGYPSRYDRSVVQYLYPHRDEDGQFVPAPRLFISGHSHILKVMMDDKLGCLHINPGAAGLYGQQAVRTLVRFCIVGPDIRDLEVIELY